MSAVANALRSLARRFDAQSVLALDKSPFAVL